MSHVSQHCPLCGAEGPTAGTCDRCRRQAEDTRGPLFYAENDQPVIRARQDTGSDLAKATARLLQRITTMGAGGRIVSAGARDDVLDAAAQVQTVLDRWSAQGNPADISAADRRERYLLALALVLEAGGDMTLGAFDHDGLATEAAKLRAQLVSHQAACASIWTG